MVYAQKKRDEPCPDGMQELVELITMPSSGSPPASSSATGSSWDMNPERIDALFPKMDDLAAEEVTDSSSDCEIVAEICRCQECMGKLVVPSAKVRGRTSPPPPGNTRTMPMFIHFVFIF